MITFLDPTGRVGEAPKHLSPGFPVLTGKRIAVLDNLKPHAGYIMRAIAERLAKRSGAVVSLEIAKVSAALPAEAEAVEQLKNQADLVITGSADCGSCTSWSVHDTVALEQLGLPTILLATEGFTDIAHQICALNGLAQARILTVRGPLGGSPDADLDAMADEVLEQALQLVTT